MHRSFLFSVLLPTACLLSVGPVLAEQDWKAVGQALGKEGSVMDGGVYRVGMPRSDLKVTLDGVELKPALALGSWVAFQPMADNDAMLMGDLVLTQDEVNPVMSVLLQDGLQVTALHNHLFRADPATLYMHVSGRGDPIKLASALHDALAQSKTPLGESPAPAASQPQIDLDTAAIDAALGNPGKVNGGVYQESIPRADPVKENGMDVEPAMGTAIAINFQPTGGGKAATTGDFVLTAEEVNPVLKALRADGIEVTALHSHMLDEEPRLFFMHFWANDDLTTLLHGLSAALGEMAVQR
ncbi:MAG: hypothetical protein JWQ89_783 [Devosia sp.]|uniref:DUF1259 domain-containing protein n=1 Tax=Devosia sp. TaxID=1871048 RepID=UPI002616E83A|nr:DUF1259 domain-containing protein [Devosia sp.]MDB5539056.1 hypothetical protein [Devosia sp.]